MTRIDHHTPRRYAVRHTTEYRYDDEVTASFGRACLRPRATSTQRVEEHTISVEPTPDVLDEHHDFFGNYSHYVEIDVPHGRLTVTKESVVAVDVPRVDLTALDAWTVAEAAAAVRAEDAVDPLERTALTLPSMLVDLGPEVRAFAATILVPDRPLGQALTALVTEIYDTFEYAKGATTVKTTLPEVLASRSGVCQDFAHLAVGCLRAAGLPARYVSGYIETTPPPGDEKLAGSDATHAWASVLVPGGYWVDLDPTNNHLADSRYIVTAWGRDFRDVSPLKGVIFTQGKRSRLSVSVEVSRLPD